MSVSTPTPPRGGPGRPGGGPGRPGGGPGGHRPPPRHGHHPPPPPRHGHHPPPPPPRHGHRPPPPPPSSQGCYVATCVYGSYDCPQVWTLRRFRDQVLSVSLPGRLFIRLYYALSPTLVRLFGRQSWFRSFWRPRLDRLVARLQARGMGSSPYQDR